MNQQPETDLTDKPHPCPAWGSFTIPPACYGSIVRAPELIAGIHAPTPADIADDAYSMFLGARRAYLRAAFRQGTTPEQLARLVSMDPTAVRLVLQGGQG